MCASANTLVVRILRNFEALPREKAKVKYNDEKENKKNKMIVVIKIAA